MSEQMTSNKPYIVRAFYEWILDNQLTPYIVVDTTVYGVLVPLAYVQDNQIVLNVSPDAVGSISLAGDAIEFSARFGGKLERITVPYASVSAIYAKENGAGTSLAVEHVEPPEESVTDIKAKAEETPVKPLSSIKGNASSLSNTNKSSNKPKGKPSLKVIK